MWTRSEKGERGNRGNVRRKSALSKTGFVTIVGAGPGDIGLLTLAGLDAIRLADVVLYDRKIIGELQALIPPDTEALDLSAIKEQNEGNIQIPISDLVVKLAKEGKNVARLKAGDPSIFGREDKEIDRLLEEGIPYRIIPGITSAIAAPVYAGVPITHRDCSEAIHIVTAVSKDGTPTPIAYRELVGLDGTMIFLMANGLLAEIRDGLMAAGMPGDMPAVYVENGTFYNQRRIVSTIAEVPSLVEKADKHIPALLAVGKACSFADKYDWTRNLPLWGKRMLVVGMRRRRNTLTARLRAAGCSVDEYLASPPQPVPVPRQFCDGLRYYTWIVFTAAAGAEAFFHELDRHSFDSRRLADINFAAIGRGAGRVLAGTGIFPEYAIGSYDLDALAHDVHKHIRIGDKVLLYGACPQDSDLADMLRRVGVVCDQVHAYAPAPVDAKGGGFRDRLEAGEYDALAFASAAAVNAFAALMEGVDLSRARAICLDEIIAQRARALGMRAEAGAEANVEGMVRQVKQALAGIRD